MYLIAILFLLTPLHAADNLAITPLDADRRLLRELPFDPASESTLLKRMRSVTDRDPLARTMPPEDVVRAKTLAWGIIERQLKHLPHQRQNTHIESAYLTLFTTSWHDSSMSEEEILDIVRGLEQHATMNPHLVYSAAPLMLVNRTGRFAEAEALARRGLERVEGLLHVRLDRESREEHQRRKGYLGSKVHDALGWSLTHQGRYDEAMQAYSTALEQDNRNKLAWYHYGRTMEMLGDLDTAESLYRRCISIPSPFPEEHPAENALRELYFSATGSYEGYSTYRDELTDESNNRRMGEVLADKLSEPNSVEPFLLRSIAGDPVDLDKLKGKIAVLNFWGIWCGFCVVELPELQLLYEKYGGDSDVVVLTINNDRPPEKVRPWMGERGYTFPVLADDGYVKKQGISAFPTTWFIDRSGNIVFVKKGFTPNLLQEFSWRIESLR